MTIITDEHMNVLTSRIESVRSELGNAKFWIAKKLLAMALLELRLKHHAISDIEFKQFCRALTVRQGSNAKINNQKISDQVRQAEFSNVIQYKNRRKL